MKFLRTLSAITALALAALSGQAHAAKVFTLTGSETGFTSIDLPDFDPTFVNWSHTMGLNVKFAQPFTGFTSFEFEFSYYVYDKFGNELEANEIDYMDGFHALSGAKNTSYRFRLPTSRTLPRWTTTGPGVVMYSLRPAGLNIVANDDQVPFNYTVTGFHAVPEPATWALMIVGFGAVGAAMRRVRPSRFPASISFK